MTSQKGKNAYLKPTMKKEKLKINFFTKAQSVTTALLDHTLDTRLTAYCHYDCSWMKC